MMSRNRENRIQIKLDFYFRFLSIFLMAISTSSADVPKQTPSVVNTGTKSTNSTSAVSSSSKASPSALDLSLKTGPNFNISSDDTSIVETYPSLKKYLFTEKNSNTYIGFGMSPVTIVNSKLAFSLNIFQVHWIQDKFDFEIFSFSYGFSFGQNQSANSDYFVFRTIPKIKIFGNVSVGPLLGLEFVSFPGLQSQLNKNNLFTPSETFSSSGFIYGASISETFTVGKNYLVKINEIGYQETYSHLGTSNGWNYYFPSDTSLNTDPTPIKPSFVIVLEVSILY